MQIWKKDAPFLHNQTLTFYHSHDGGLLCLKEQRNAPVIYFKNDPNKDQEFKTTIKSVVTGQDFHDIGWTYIDTLILDNGSYVVHYFQQGQFVEKSS